MFRANVETEWPYPIRYDVENGAATDILVLGGGMAGPIAAITAARKGLNVILVDKGSTIHSGFAGSGFDHWTNCPNPASPVSAEELTEARLQVSGGYANSIGNYINAREGFSIIIMFDTKNPETSILY